MTLKSALVRTIEATATVFSLATKDSSLENAADTFLEALWEAYDAYGAEEEE